MNIFTIGGSGLVGTRIAEILKESYTIDDLSLTNGVDITNTNSLDIIRNDTKHDFVIHLAAKSDVDGCENDKSLGENGAAFKINVDGVRNVTDACMIAKKKLIYISTDFVFDGLIEPPNKYKEDDKPNPLNWYATTKYKGEEVVINSKISFAIIRIAYPYRADEFPLKKDFVHAVMGRLSQNLPITAVTDHIMTPTFIDDIAYGIDAIIRKNAEGIFHVVGSQSLSPYDAFILMADRFGYDKNLITKTTRKEYFKGKAIRPFNLSLNNAKIEKLGLKMRSFENGLKEVSKI